MIFELDIFLNLLKWSTSLLISELTCEKLVKKNLYLKLIPNICNFYNFMKSDKLI